MKKILTVFSLFFLIALAYPQLSKAVVGTCCYDDSACTGTEVCTIPEAGSVPYGTCSHTAGKTCQLPPEEQGLAGDTCTPTGNECQDGYNCVYSTFGYACVPESSYSLPSPAANDPTCDGGNGIDTAIGCIPVNDTDAFVGFILKWAIGIGGGIAFLLILFAGFQIMTSSGNPDKLKGGQELLTSAIAGLILLIFSVFILKIIGIDILQLPGFGG